MHPILGNRRRLGIYLLAWLNIGLLLALGLRGDASWLAAFVFFLPLALAYAFISLSAWYVCRAFPITGTRTWNVVAVQVVAAGVAAAIWIGAAAGWARTLDWLSPVLLTVALYTAQRPLLVVVAALLFWLAAVFHYMLIAFESSREAETRALELNVLAREAELKALRAQIDPHFIFNSLHSISALTATDPVAARRMCLLLADFLRETLRLGSSSRISLAEEITLAERFLAIEQVRLGARLRVACDTDPQAASCLVPPLLLQPLVENAVVHGVAQMVEGGTIRMAAKRVGPMVTITLENPCDPDRAQTRGVGLGLDLLRQRLVTQFGVYEAVEAAEGDGQFRVEVRIPFTAAA
jgi:two-component system sensor histidine kinase AlgZ